MEKCQNIIYFVLILADWDIKFKPFQIRGISLHSRLHALFITVYLKRVLYLIFCKIGLLRNSASASLCYILCWCLHVPWGFFFTLCLGRTPPFLFFSVGHNHFLGHGWWPQVGFVHWSCIRSQRNLNLNEWNSTVGSTSWKSKPLQINIYQVYIPKLCSNKNFSHRKIGRSTHFH